jgi:glutamate-1-semialdehyde 2,1-aminomutase
MDPLTTLPSLDDPYRVSTALHEEASRYLAGGVSSNFRLGGPVPLFFARACGSRVYTVDDRNYVDYALGMGPVILGHAPPKVIRKVSECLADGQLYAGQHEAEQTLARLVCSAVPCAERVRFGCSGSEAVQAALRLARGCTGRDKIVKFEGHYHGWFDNIYVGVHPAAEPDGSPHPESAGQPAASYQDTIVLPWNDIEAFEAVLCATFREIAGVIMEPILCNTSVILPRPGYLEKVRELCSSFGVVLIFDEVITGFRVGLGGAQGLLGVTPDLAVFAKAMGGGFPISCLAGKAELMELIASGRVMHGGTYNTNVVSVVAAVATLEELSASGALAYQALHERGGQLMEELSSLARARGLPFLVQGLGPVFHTAFTDVPAITDYRTYCRADAGQLSRFLAALLDGGVHVTRRGVWFLSTAHTSEDIEQTLGVADEALREVA